MRNNQPITQMETLLPEGQFIYSRTDLRGIIVEANEAFAHISGYRREDMIGSRTIWCATPTCPNRPSKTCGATSNKAAPGAAW